MRNAIFFLFFCLALCRALSHPLPHRHLGAWLLRKSRVNKGYISSFFLSDSQGLGHSASKASSSALHFLKSLLLGGDAEENAEGGQRLGRSGPLSRRLGKGGFGGAIARGEAKTIPPGGELGRFFFLVGWKRTRWDAIPIRAPPALAFHSPTYLYLSKH